MIIMKMTSVEKVVFLVIAMIFVLIMSGCSFPTVEERFDIAIVCQQDETADCTKEWDDYNRGVAAQERRDREQRSPCGKGLVVYCNHSCGMTKRRGEVAGVCVPEGRIFY